VRQDAARNVLEAIPLLHEVVAYVVSDLVDQPTVGVGDLRDLGRVDDDLAPSATAGSVLYIALAAVQRSS
jgi:hypothetical protein